VAPRRRARPAADPDAASPSRTASADADAPRGVGTSDQARKALTLRSPFDGEEASAGRDPWLPARVARWAAVGDVRRNHKKAQPPSEAPPPPLEQPKAARSNAFWDKLEPYFREITLDDFEALVPAIPTRLDPCFVIPILGSGRDRLSVQQAADPSDVAVVSGNSNSSNLISGKENEDPENHKLHANHESSDFVMRLANGNGTSEEHCHAQGMQEVILQQEDQPAAIHLIDPGGGHEQNLDASLNWLLGARGRFVLTSERPSKKRKLLGADAGLEQLVRLPPLEGEAGPRCDVCCLGESDAASNRMLRCNSCEVSVHQKCYGVQVMPDGYWMCAWCDSICLARSLTLNDEGRIVSMPCVLCPKEKGALKPVKCEPGQTADMNFAHLFCSLWAPEVFVEDMESMEPVSNIGDIPENRTRMVCSLCKVMHGACVRCSHGMLFHSSLYIISK
jgi:hypothetical protein